MMHLPILGTGGQATRMSLFSLAPLLPFPSSTSLCIASASMSGLLQGVNTISFRSLTYIRCTRFIYCAGMRSVHITTSSPRTVLIQPSREITFRKGPIQLTLRQNNRHVYKSRLGIWTSSICHFDHEVTVPAVSYDSLAPHLGRQSCQERVIYGG